MLYGVDPAGEIPLKVLGEFQLPKVEGDWPGDDSSLMEWAEAGCARVEAVLGTMSRLSGIFFKWPRCFSSMLSNPSLVNGLGRTSFMPCDYGSASAKRR